MERPYRHDSTGNIFVFGAAAVDNLGAAVERQEKFCGDMTQIHHFCMLHIADEKVFWGSQKLAFAGV